jgi:hypothetical protein
LAACKRLLSVLIGSKEVTAISESAFGFAGITKGTKSSATDILQTKAQAIKAKNRICLVHFFLMLLLTLL